jgi:hypothetical protein
MQQHCSRCERKRGAHACRVRAWEEAVRTVATAAAFPPPPPAPKLPVQLPPWHMVGNPPSSLTQAYGGFWHTDLAPTAGAVQPDGDAKALQALMCSVRGTCAHPLPDSCLTPVATAALGALRSEACMTGMHARGHAWLQVELRVAGKGACESGAAVVVQRCPEGCEDVSAPAGVAACGVRSLCREHAAVVGFVTSAFSPDIHGFVGGRACVSMHEAPEEAAASTTGQLDPPGLLGRVFIVNPYSVGTLRHVLVQSVHSLR